MTVILEYSPSLMLCFDWFGLAIQLTGDRWRRQRLVQPAVLVVDETFSQPRMFEMLSKTISGFWRYRLTWTLVSVRQAERCTTHAHDRSNTDMCCGANSRLKRSEQTKYKKSVNCNLFDFQHMKSTQQVSTSRKWITAIHSNCVCVCVCCVGHLSFYLIGRRSVLRITDKMMWTWPRSFHEWERERKMAFHHHIVVVVLLYLFLSLSSHRSPFRQNLRWLRMSDITR